MNDSENIKIIEREKKVNTNTTKNVHRLNSIKLKGFQNRSEEAVQETAAEVTANAAENLLRGNTPAEKNKKQRLQG